MFLGFPEVTLPKVDMASKAKALYADILEAPQDVIATDTFTADNIASALSRIFPGSVNPPSFLNDDQERAFNTIMAAATKPVLVVLGTSAGKSLLFQLSSVLHSIHQRKVTVVVVPFVALIANALTQAQANSVKTVVWESERTVLDVDDMLLLVSADRAVTSPFRRFLGSCITNSSLARIFFDEAHVPWLHKDFRAKIAAGLAFLKTLAVPLVLLTATCPLQEVVEVLKPFELMPEEMEQVRSASTRRTNLCYRVRSHPDSDEALKDFISDCLDPLEQDRKILLFVKAKKEAERLAYVLGALYYHANYSGKEAALEAFSDPDNNRRIMVATTALTHGIHHPSIAHVIHLDPPYTLVEFA